MSLVIRTFRHADAPAVIAVLTGTMRSTWEPRLTAAARETIDIDMLVRDYVTGMGERFVLAESDGQIRGMIHWADDFIHALHVDPAIQRRGIGAQLLAHAEKEMGRAGQSQARLETDTFNTQSRAFYTKHGYVEKDRYPDTQWQSGFTTLLLVKPL